MRMRSCRHRQQTTFGSSDKIVQVCCTQCSKQLLMVEINTVGIEAWKFLAKKDKSLKSVLETLLVRSYDHSDTETEMPIAFSDAD